MAIIAMYDAEISHLVFSEVRQLRSIVSRFIVLLVVLVSAAGAGGYYYHDQYRRLRDTEQSRELLALAEKVSELSLAQEQVRSLRQQLASQQLPRTPSGQVLYPGPSAPPKFPEGVKFATDYDNPKGFKAVNPSSSIGR